MASSTVPPVLRRAKDVRSNVTKVQAYGSGERQSPALAASSSHLPAPPAPIVATPPSFPPPPSALAAASALASGRKTEQMWTEATWTWTKRRGWMRLAGCWTEVPVVDVWSEKPGRFGADGVPEVITLILDKKVGTALAMIEHDPSLPFLKCTEPSSMAGNNLLHVLAHRGVKEWGPEQFRECTYVLGVCAAPSERERLVALAEKQTIMAHPLQNHLT